jgi:hypothetical protein
VRVEAQSSTKQKNGHHRIEKSSGLGNKNEKGNGFTKVVKARK